MSNRRSVRGAPADYVADGVFPDAAFRADAPAAVWWAADIALLIHAGIGDRALSRVASDADVGRATTYDILSGRTWPDLVTIVKLQSSLGVTLWPTRSPTWTPHPDR